MRMLASTPLVAAIAITASVGAHAQVTTGTIRGVVRDDAGNPLKNVTVYLTPSKGEALTSVTDKNGAYVFLGVQPGTYMIRAELETFKTSEDQTITITQDVVSTVDVALSKTVTQTGSTTVKVAPVRKGQSNTQYNITSTTEQRTKSQPNNLYQFPGLVFGQPGVTPDPSGYVHIRGADQNQVGFEVDGIKTTSFVDNQFATNIVTVGLKSANLITGGADATYGGSVGGFINLATQNGRDLKGGILEYTAGPGGGWQYNGANLQYGNVSGNGKLDYYASTILFNNKFPGSTVVDKVSPSNDELLKLNYYADQNNTVTLYLSNGREKYSYYQLPGPEGSPYLTFDPRTGSAVTQSDFTRDFEEQSYEFHYLNFKHNFSPRSVINLKQFYLADRVAFNIANTNLAYENKSDTQNGTQLDYTNQLAPNDILRAGLSYVAAATDIRIIQSLTDELSADNPYYVYDRGSRVHPNLLEGYLTNQIRAMDSKLTIDTGIRYGQQQYKLEAPDFAASDSRAAGINVNSLTPVAAHDGGLLNSYYVYGNKFTPHYVDPRIGVTYAPKNDLIFRSSFGTQSQFADTYRVETLPYSYFNLPGIAPTVYAGDINEEGGAANVSNRILSQRKSVLNNYAPFNPLKPAHSNNFDLGVEKGFNLKGFLTGQYAVGLTGFRRVAYDLIQYNRPSFDIVNTPTSQSLPRYYDNGGKGHTSGIEFILSKRPVNKTDWNGFASYTNQSAKATNSNFDTGYIPYFYNAASGDPSLTDADYRRLDAQEYPLSYDQKHTVAVVANKRVWKWFDTTVVLDAGSGFPFAGGSQSDGSFFGGGDPQHSEKALGGADFTQVPTVLLDGKTIQPINPIVGRTGWHYKFSLNSNFHLTETTNAFLNIDNVFTRNTPTTYATVTQAGQIYYTQPSAAYPQGRVYYGPSTILSPRFVSFGIRMKF